jgi:hypothetical protein
MNIELFFNLMFYAGTHAISIKMCKCVGLISVNLLVSSQIQEQLTIARGSDSDVTIRIPVQREVFDDFSKKAGLVEASGSRFRVRDYSVFAQHLGEDWDLRVSNDAGDHARVNLNTLTVWLQEQCPLVTYTSKLKKKLIHRGYNLVVHFVKDYGNRLDLPSI